ncbi:hypothetical protein PIB30_041465 [Stylosanthes scabra]|uniref:Methyltransferase n=1 Tax=Stylosanthes scabra TaxID=79078 RepID=A0ABU6ZDP3_9FABA|nr:hypothetical protein [Stylosanthes scabra]
MMKGNDGKPIIHSEKCRILPMTIIFVLLCGFSFYMGGIFCSERNRFLFINGQKSLEPSKNFSSAGSVQIKSINFPECGVDYQDYTPCTDPRKWRKYGSYRLTLLERHCPPIFERKECLVPPPDGYKPPIRWPKSRDECWYRYN